MMRSPLRLLIVVVVTALVVTIPAAGGVFNSGATSSSGGTCIDGTQDKYAPSYRATTLTGFVPGFACDGVLERCVEVGPGARQSIGSNEAGEMCLGPCSGSGTLVRLWGELVALTVTATNAVVSNVITIGAAIDFNASAFLRNPTAGRGVLIDDPDGLRIKPVTALTACTASTQDGALIPLAPAAGAGTGLKWCACESDYATTPTFRWTNFRTGARGSGTTDCP